MVNVAIVGVGNCANSFLQGLAAYRDAPDDQPVPGLMNVRLGGYHVRDVTVVAAFDVAEGKVGLNLADAIWAAPNDTIRFAEVPRSDVTVSRGPTLDGIGRYLKDAVTESPLPPVEVARVLRESGADVLINYLPVGSEAAARFYAAAALEAGCGMVNCMPVFLASDREWGQRFRSAGLPILGDDIKSQVGATIVHRALAQLCKDRGVKVERAYQLNVGGNSDFLNMLERDRLDSKKRSKTQAVACITAGGPDQPQLHVGPSDHVPWLTDRKFAFIRIEGSGFGGVPLEMDVHLRVWDSPNSAGVVIDAVRLVKLAKDRGIGGPLEGPSAYLMKSPPVQMRDEAAAEEIRRFVERRIPGNR